MARSDSRKPVPAKDQSPAKLPSTKEIMSSYVNDNTPGYMYWFTRILAFSIVSYIIYELIRTW